MASVIAFTSGKGGVGKTNIATNLGLSLLARNAKVCLFDADTGLANINIVMGVSPQHTIEQVLNGQKTIDEIIYTHPSGISIVPAASGIQQCTDLNSDQIGLLKAALEKLEKKFDYLLVDTAAGIDSNVLDFVASAQYRVIVITSEPTSLTDSFALLKMLIVRGKRKSIYILVNKVDGYQRSQIVFKRFQKAVKAYLKIDVHYFGYLSNDDCVNRAVYQQVPVVLSYPNSSVSCGFASLADIIKKQFRNDKNIPFFSRYWTLNTQQEKKELEPVARMEKEIHLKSTKPDSLANVYKSIEQLALSEAQLKELVLTLETIYEKKYKLPVKGTNSVVASILAEGDAINIRQLHDGIAKSFERQFEKKINNPVVAMEDFMNDEELSKSDFNRLMENFSAIYQQRFNDKYFAEGNLLLTQIQQLLLNKN